MFESLFGAEMPLAARFFIAFLVVLALIGLTAWLVRRFGANRLGNASRGRQPRLAVIDAATVDGRRRLVLIRRDNVEHLLMIGGPSDLVVEPNIVRAVSARDVPRDQARAAPAGEAAARQTPTIENGWPLQPATEPAPASRPHRPSATEEPWLRPNPAPGPARPKPHRTCCRTIDAPELSRRWRRPLPARKILRARQSLRTSRQRRPITISQKWRTNSKLLCGARPRRKAGRRSPIRWRSGLPGKGADSHRAPASARAPRARRAEIRIEA